MEFQAPSFNLLPLLPFLILVSSGLVLMLLDLLLPQRDRLIGWFSLVVYVAALVQTVALWGGEWSIFTPRGGQPMLLVDNFSNFLNVIFLLSGAFAVLLAVNYLDRVNLQRAEFYYLMMFSISGMMLMGMANDLILVFLALELLSIPLYILSGFARPLPASGPPTGTAAPEGPSSD